jgi:CheY-like chemotaxis protein
MAKKNKLVMLVDDNDTDNFISQKIIELNGFAERVIAKNSGKSALEYLEAHENNTEELPEVIFLDINMPIVDGFVFLFEFERFNEALKKKCKIAILSSSDNKRDIERIVDNDYVVKYITKPLTQDALSEISEVL